MRHKLTGCFKVKQEGAKENPNGWIKYSSTATNGAKLKFYNCSNYAYTGLASFYRRFSMTEIVIALRTNAESGTGTDTYSLTPFMERPRETGERVSVPRIEAFDLFNIFTAEVIRSQSVFYK